jgi:hypothetical protein
VAALWLFCSLGLLGKIILQWQRRKLIFVEIDSYYNMKLLRLFNFLILCSVSLPVSGHTIDSLAILPSNPTSADQIQVVCYSTFTSGGCDLSNFSVTISGTHISVQATHVVGMLAVICNRIDTLSIGQLPAGTYQFDYHLYDSLQQDTADTDTIQFVVGPSNGVSEAFSGYPGIRPYPNPSNGWLGFSGLETLRGPLQCTIYSAQGQLLKQASLAGASSKIDVSGLATGVYRAVLQSGDTVFGVTGFLVE